MKKTYINIKKWICETEDGESIVIFKGDKVKVSFNFNEGDVSKEFLEQHPDNTITLRIAELSGRSLLGEEINRPYHYIRLYPRNIITIEKI